MSVLPTREEKIALLIAAQAEIERLMSLSVIDLAAELLPAIGAKTIRDRRSVCVRAVSNWLLREFPGAWRFNPLQLQVLPLAREGLQELERAGLVRSFASQGSVSLWQLTHLGEDALAQSTVAPYVNGGPPHAGLGREELRRARRRPNRSGPSHRKHLAARTCPV